MPHSIPMEEQDTAIYADYIPSPSTPYSEPEIEEDTDGPVTEEEMNEWLSARYDAASAVPMKLPLTEAWGLDIGDADLAKIAPGLRERDMDDKWEILIEDLDDDGHVTVHIIRSWLQDPWYNHNIERKQDSEGAIIQRITWEGNIKGLQCGGEQAKKEVVMLMRTQKRCEIEALPDYPRSVFWQSSAYTRIAPEEV